MFIIDEEITKDPDFDACLLIALEKNIESSPQDRTRYLMVHAIMYCFSYILNKNFGFKDYYYCYVSSIISRRLEEYFAFKYIKRKYPKHHAAGRLVYLLDKGKQYLAENFDEVRVTCLRNLLPKLSYLSYTELMVLPTALKVVNTFGEDPIEFSKNLRYLGWNFPPSRIKVLLNVIGPLEVKRKIVEGIKPTRKTRIHSNRNSLI
jgi:hypothetical protein